MKAITEFPQHILEKGLQAKTALTTEGKTPEEIQQSLGESFKYEGDKLKCFANAIDVAGQNMEKLTRIRVINFSEGENIPPKATKLEEYYYVPEFATPPGKPMTQKIAPGGGKGGAKKGARRDGPKSSPWGPSPEEIAAKKEASLKAAKAKQPQS